MIHLNDLKTVVDFMKGLQGATLDDPHLGMSIDTIHHLWNLPHEPPTIIDRVTHLAIDLYLATPLAVTYKTICEAMWYFDSNIELPSYYKIQHLVADITGIESVVHHICINSCVAYTGPFMDLDACPVCSEPRYN
jgi:hypothetical protein